MFGLSQLVVLAERDSGDKTMNVRNEPHPELRVWLWRRKALFLMTGALVLALLIISGNGV